MGNTYSTDDNVTSSFPSLSLSLSMIKRKILRKCDCYVSSIEHTNSEVDVKLDTLREEISSLCQSLKELKEFQSLDMLAMAAVMEDLELYGDVQREIIQKFLTLLHESQQVFEEITCRYLWPTETKPQQDNQIEEIREHLDEICMNEIRGRIESIITNYLQDIEDLPVSDQLKNKRCEEFQRLLFKLGESTVSEAVSDFVYELKDAAIEEIDKDLTVNMLSGEFSNPEFVKASLQHLMIKSMVTRNSLEELPFSRRTELESAQDEISVHVDQLVRRIQLNYVHSPEDLKIVMNLQYPDLWLEGSEENGHQLIENEEENKTEDGEEEEEDDYEHNDDDTLGDQSTIVEKLESSDDESEEGEGQGTENDEQMETAQEETAQGETLVDSVILEEPELEQEDLRAEEIEEGIKAIESLAQNEDQEDVVLNAIQNVKDKIENLKQAMGPFSQVESYSEVTNGLYSSPFKGSGALTAAEMSLVGNMIINLAEESETEQNHSKLQYEETQLDENDNEYSQLSQPELLSQDRETQEEPEQEPKKGRRKTVELAGKKRTRRAQDNSQSDVEDSDTSQVSYSLRRKEVSAATRGYLHHETSLYTNTTTETKRRRKTREEEDGEMSASESVTSSTTGRRTRGTSRYA